MSSLLIQNATINGRTGQFDLLIEEGVFKAIEQRERHRSALTM